MSVTAALGFAAAGVAAGIKASGGLDLALVACDTPAATAATFTRNRAAAPPVVLSRERVAAGPIRAVVLNSGCANAATGAGGRADAETTTRLVADALGCPDTQVLVCSTGPIGTRLPMDRVAAAVPGLVARLGSDEDHARAAAEAILTTDSVPKQASVSIGPHRIGGMAKGAGMLRPDMATMLAVLTTDAALEAEPLSEILAAAVETTFNCLDVDGCESTNDTVVLLASGRSGPVADRAGFSAALAGVCRSLARAMAADAEGAFRVVTLRVSGTPDDATARGLGRAMADSPLVRAAFHGGDPNWGRLVAAMGASRLPFDPAAVAISYAGTAVAAGGVGVAFDGGVLAARLAGDFEISVVVGDGPGRAEVVTTDLTPDYVRFNSERS
jgi:glutamate N-acetyltransferase/amino-acid N-acetyltransferase